MHAGVAVKKKNRKGLYRLCKYASRPPFAQSNLTHTEDGKLKLKLKSRYFDGRTHMMFTAMELLARLAAIVPPKRFNLTRYYGCFCPNAKERKTVVALIKPAEPAEKQHVPEPTIEGEAESSSEPTEPISARYRMSWSICLRKTFGIDVMVCPQCDGKMRLVSNVDKPSAIARILEHLGLPSSIDELKPARAPPQMELFEQNTDDDFCQLIPDDDPVFELT